MTDRPFIDTVILIALPASGKSEVRRYLHHVPRSRRIEEFHISDTVQLDDFPYVHFMRCIDEELVKRGQPRQFYKGANAGFANGVDWGVLLHLVNEDYAVIRDPSAPTPPKDARHLFARIDAARRRLDAQPVLSTLDANLREDIADALEGETIRLVDELFSERPDTLADKTVVIEFARGGPEGATMPLSPPHGYAWNLGQLSPEILERAGVLYIWVSPEESRRKNAARANPDDPGSILHHSAPESVMRDDYGCCDIAWLVEHSDQPNTIRIESHGRVFHLPIARFDNRVDKTSFVRDDPDTWDAADNDALHQGLAGPLGELWAVYSAR